MPTRYLKPSRGTGTEEAALPHGRATAQSGAESAWRLLSDDDSVQSLPNSDDAGCAQYMLVGIAQEVLLPLGITFLGAEFGRRRFPVLVPEACFVRSDPRLDPRRARLVA